nr:hypothetical protein [Candidatus Sigynarchaeum springense]
MADIAVDVFLILVIVRIYLKYNFPTFRFLLFSILIFLGRAIIIVRQILGGKYAVLLFTGQTTRILYEALDKFTASFPPLVERHRAEHVAAGRGRCPCPRVEVFRVQRALMGSWRIL